MSNERRQRVKNDIETIYTTLKQRIPYLGSTQARTIKVVLSSYKSAEVCGDIIRGAFGCFDGSSTLFLNITTNDGTAGTFKTTVAHELLHTFTTEGGYSKISMDPYGTGAHALDEMTTEYYAQLVYPSGSQAYTHLTPFMPTILNLLKLAGATNPQDTWQKSFYGQDLSKINTIFAPYLEKDNFIKNLASFLSEEERKSDSAGAKAYLDVVASKIRAKNTPTTGGGVITTTPLPKPAPVVTSPSSLPKTSPGTTTPKPTAVAACPDGVLIRECASDKTLPEYLKLVLKQLIPLILFIAMIMIAWSGVQYMLSGFKPDNATKAKQRIVGIVIGALFFLSIGLVINWISPNLGL